MIRPMFICILLIFKNFVLSMNRAAIAKSKLYMNIMNIMNIMFIGVKCNITRNVTESNNCRSE